MDRPSGFLRRPRRTFRDRREAGRVLATELASYRGKAVLLVLGLASGGGVAPRAKADTGCEPTGADELART